MSSSNRRERELARAKRERQLATAQQRICAEIRAHDADTARDWMSRHIRDFRRGFEVSGIDLDSPVAAPR